MKRGFGNMSNDNEWRDSDTKDINAIVHNTVEFTLKDKLTEAEVMLVLSCAKHRGIKTNVSKSRRIITTGADYVDEATGILADALVIEQVALIKHITEYEIQYDKEIISI
tara:strand:+ start:462 stop:791 length:330 start_codon:yes stop_codon:yes gene_type:complete